MRDSDPPHQIVAGGRQLLLLVEQALRDASAARRNIIAKAADIAAASAQGRLGIQPACRLGMRARGTASVPSAFNRAMNFGRIIAARRGTFAVEWITPLASRRSLASASSRSNLAVHYT
ncbi:MAG: hypothetical protein AB7U75_20065 [Hyphomicrobiaceae bacterium]